MPGRDLDANELEAGEIVASHLGGTARPLDVAGAPEMTCDFDIEFADGHDAALEVTSSREGAVLSLLATAFGREHPVPDLANDWLIGLPQPTRDSTVQMRRLLSRIPELLAVLEVRGINEMSTPSVHVPVEPVPAEVKAAFASIRALGATTVRSMGPHASPPAQLLVTVHAGVIAQIDEVNRLVEEAAASNANKLRAATGDAKHLFIWLDPSHSDAELAVFTGALPDRPAMLPVGVDVVWLATRGPVALGQVGVQRLWRVAPPQPWECLIP
jgi:hypothetical protein